jgi:small conductance mechanosensitive channel
MRKHTPFAGTALVALLLAVAASPVLAQSTSTDPAVDEARLEILLRPLTLEELSKEVKDWYALLQAKAKEIRDEKIKEGGGDPERIQALESERDEIISRFARVLDAYKAKGGDASEGEAYVAAVRPAAKKKLLDVENMDVKEAGKLVTRAVDWLKSRDGGIALGLNILLFIAVLAVFKILASILGKITQKATRRMKKTSELLRDFFVNTVKKITFFIGLVIALSVLGVDIGPFLAAIGAIGFIIGFALQGTLSNFACGIMILLYRPYDIGNVVTVAGVTGKVSAMSLVSTTIHTPDNQVVVVPNSSIWGDVITNITGSDTRRVDMVVGIGYEDDIAKAQGVLEGILSGHEKILKDPAPVIKLHELADSSVNFVVRPWARTSDYWDVYWDVTRQVKERFDEEGISIPFPQRDVHLHQATTG